MSEYSIKSFDLKLPELKPELEIIKKTENVEKTRKVEKMDKM